MNGKLVSFDTPLHNGAVVEILRRDSAHPSPKWLEVAKTSLAKKQIRAVLGLGETEIQKTIAEPRKRRRAKPKNS